jgi:hypothetical protein
VNDGNLSGGLMATVTVPAHVIDDEFESEIAKVDVRIIDRTNAPWAVVFEGPRAGLEAILRKSWGGEESDIQQMIDIIVDDEPAPPASKPLHP